MNFTGQKKISHHHDQYDVESPTECWQLNIIAAYCIVIFISSFIVNILLLLVFYRSQKLRTPINSFVIFFTVLSFIGATSEFSFIIPTNIKCRWLWGKTGCYVSGFIMYWVGCTQIYIMAAISLERFVIIFKPLSLKGITFKMSYAVMALCSLLSLVTSSAPLFGWSYYSLEGSLTSCGVEWAERSTNVISYNIFIFVVSFVIPVSIIIPCNLKLLTIVKNVSKHTNSKEDEITKKRDAKERSLTIVMMVYIVGFIISWFPYAMVFLYSAVLGSIGTPLLGTIPSMFAKSSFLWSSLVFIYSSKQIRKKIISEFTGKEPDTGATQSSVGHTTYGLSANTESIQNTQQIATQTTKA